MAGDEACGDGERRAYPERDAGHEEGAPQQREPYQRAGYDFHPQRQCFLFLKSADIGPEMAVLQQPPVQTGGASGVAPGSQQQKGRGRQDGQGDSRQSQREAERSSRREQQVEQPLPLFGGGGAVARGLYGVPVFQKAVGVGAGRGTSSAGGMMSITAAASRARAASTAAR